ncbi:hypothetical protein LshimejAT787_0705340 [Lyophyllum shimeji]|uniref:DUF6533 domain-containing protein n=1 Tax=Lyophyllum shimeji TaxID=47721 RepID=A0A9P3PR26_LYOSH|nr:hypothetical protein LshimejAT787_0705340 [Lyophyllum shimeji]
MQPPHFARNCSAFAALSVLIWDGLITYPHEYQHIWKTPTGAVKRMYLLTRYFGGISQITNVALMLGPLAPVSIPMRTCAIWFGFQLISFLSLMFTLEMVLSLRLYALYQQNRNIGMLLLFSISTAIILSFVCGVRTVSRIGFDEACVVRKSPREFAYFSVISFLRHVFLWIMTIRKRNVGRLGGSERAPVVQLMLRDGAWIFAVVSALLATVTPYTYLIPVVAQAMFPWPITLLSVLTCRLILNMQRLKMRTPPPSGPQLTTNISFTTTIESLATSKFESDD